MNEELIDKIKACQTLPSLPATAVAVLEMARDPDADAAGMARLVSQDAALAGKVLKTVNSSFYARAHAVGTVSQAVVMLGMQSVRTLVLGFSLVNNLQGQKSHGFKHVHYWRRSVYAATAARILAGRVKLVQVEEAFLASLLKDIGMLVFDQVLGEAYGALYATAGNHVDLVAKEREAFGLDHAQASATLAECWKLPPVLAVPMGFHHDLPAAEKADPAVMRVAELVSLAGRCADVFTDAEPAAAIAEVRDRCKSLYEMDEASADALMEEVGAKVKETASMFEIKADTSATFDVILRRANEALVELTLQTQQQAGELKAANRELEKTAKVDALTGLANRRAFDAFLAEALKTGKRGGTPVALLLLDVDKFKLVNDRHGHQVGDEVLRYLGRLLRASVRESDLAARYGGEELMLVLHDAPRQAAAERADRLRRAIAAKRVPAGGINLPITVSIGVAVYEPPAGPLSQPTHLIRAADLAVYAAKSGGRNCVKVFTLPAQKRAA